MGAPVPPMTAPALPADQSRGEGFPPHDLQGVRDALAALGIDFPPRGERPTSLDDIIARVNTLAPKTARTSAPVPVDPPSTPAQLAEPELLASVPQDVLTAVKVVRQETHLQPAGQEVRRLLEMTTVTPDERILHVSLAAATETGRKGTGDRDRREQPIAAMRALDGAAPSMAAGETAKEANFASVGQQIAHGVQRALASPSEPAASPRSVPQVDPAAQQVFAGPVRTIKLQLNPQSLGAVTIILTHRDAELSIKLEAELAETVGKVEQDRTALTAKLAGAGYAVGELTISRMATTAGGAGADAGARDSTRGRARRPSMARVAAPPTKALQLPRMSAPVAMPARQRLPAIATFRRRHGLRSGRWWRASRIRVASVRCDQGAGTVRVPGRMRRRGPRSCQGAARSACQYRRSDPLPLWPQAESGRDGVRREEQSDHEQSATAGVGGRQDECGRQGDGAAAHHEQAVG